MIRNEVQLGWKSIPGHRHQVEGRENEDAVLTSEEHPYFDALLIVADGMGGHPQPGLAARTAVSSVRDFLFQPARLEELAESRTSAVALLCRAVEHANARVRRLAAPVAPGLGDEKPPGCTLTVAAIADGRITVALVGDGSAFLCRNHQLRPLAGGEARRVGSRPEEFVGRADRVPVETVEEEAQTGDRLLLCTDGLTRYFGAGETFSEANGLSRLQQVMARPTADVRALASQLTADGRGEAYEDDTTVIVAEVGATRQVAHPPIRSGAVGEENGSSRGRARTNPDHGRASRQPPGRGSLVLLGVLLAAAAGFYGGRTWRRPVERQVPPFQPFSVPAAALPNLPPGGVLLVNRETGQFFVVRSRPAAAPVAEGPLSLSELRYLPGKGLKDTGNVYRLDSARGLLTSPRGRAYPVNLDAAAGVLQIQEPGTLRVNSQPSGLAVYIDGLSAGKTPISTSVRAGLHHVQIEGVHGRDVIYDEPSMVAPRSTCAIIVTAPASPAGQVSRP
jgi:serine/threonine protein phosphatase PrpC